VDPSAPVPDESSDPRAPAGPVDPVLLREAVGQVVPDGFHHDVVQVRVIIPHPVRAVWGWLDDPATFVDGQVWPFAVEFHHPPGTHAFRPGVRNDHHGPLLSLPAVVGAVRPPAHRELLYLYGAHVVSTRLLRPSRLLLRPRVEPRSAADAPDGDLRGGGAHAGGGLWRAGNRWFWPRLGRWCDASLSARAAGDGLRPRAELA
jgi:hypothetical protein